MVELSTIVGIIGLCTILLAFALNLFHKISQRSYSYNLMNIFGSGLLAYYALVLDSLPFLLLQLVWGFLSLVKFFIIIFKRKR
jgi:hypothetical protein